MKRRNRPRFKSRTAAYSQRAREKRAPFNTTRMPVPDIPLRWKCNCSRTCEIHTHSISWTRRSNFWISTRSMSWISTLACPTSRSASNSMLKACRQETRDQLEGQRLARAQDCPNWRRAKRLAYSAFQPKHPYRLSRRRRPNEEVSSNLKCLPGGTNRCVTVGESACWHRGAFFSEGEMHPG
jgi:hypothetical protein